MAGLRYLRLFRLEALLPTISPLFHYRGGLSGYGLQGPARNGQQPL
jgi:hypothetical protein